MAVNPLRQLPLIVLFERSTDRELAPVDDVGGTVERHGARLQPAHSAVDRRQERMRMMTEWPLLMLKRYARI